MKKILAILPAATLALTGCLSSSDDDSSASVVLPDDYIVTQMGEFVYEDGNWEKTSAAFPPLVRRGRLGDALRHLAGGRRG